MDLLMILVPAGFFIIVVVVILKLQSEIGGFKSQIDVLSDKVSEQDEQTKFLLNTYMNESRMMGFYREALIQCQDKEVVDLFQELLKDEEKHIDILEKCLSK